MSGEQEYHVGDVVNGHRWNGESWVPVAGGATSAPPSAAAPEQGKSSTKKKFGLGCLGAVGVLLLIAAVASMSGGDDEADTKADSSQTQSAGDDQAGGEAPAKEQEQEQSPKIGDAVKEGDLQFTVLEVTEAGKTVGGEFSQEEASGRWVAVKMQIENVGKQSAMFFEDSVKLIDDQDRQMSADSMAAIVANADGYAWVSDVNPGLKVDQQLYFDLPEDAQAKKLLVKGGLFSNGVTVDLTS